MDSQTTSNVYIGVMEDVINKVRKEFSNSEDVLSQLQGLWELKMMQAGAIVAPTFNTARLHVTTQDFFPSSAGKRKWDEFSSQYRLGGYIPHQDLITDQLEVGSGSNSQPGRGLKLNSSIPRPDDALCAPHIYNYQGVAIEDYNVANTPAPPELQAAQTPPLALINQNDILDEPLNENDDDLNQEEELNCQHLVLAQFDKVRQARGRWRCTLRDAIMHAYK